MAFCIPGSSITQKPEEYQWRVLNTEGKLLTQFKWPSNRTIEAVRDKYVYAIERNQETGKQEITRYQFEIHAQ